MSFFWWGLGIIALFAIVLIGVGIYELIVETRQDRASYARSNQYLHLKHLEQINHGK